VTLTRQSDNVLVAGGANPPTAQYKITAKSKLAGITGIRLEVLPDPRFRANGPGRADNGNFVLNELRVTAALGSAPPKPVAFAGAFADFSQDGWAVAGAIDNNLATGWAIAQQFGMQHQAIFQLREPLGSAEGTTFTFVLDQRFGSAHTIGKLRLSVTTSKPPLQSSSLPAAVVSILKVAPEKRTQQQKDELTRYYETLDSELPRLRAAVSEFPKPGDARAIGAQDLVWALINSKEFLFNH
jgi:hypothetical protein